MTVAATGLLPTFAAAFVPQGPPIAASDDFARALQAMAGQPTGAADAAATPSAVWPAPVPTILHAVPAAPDAAGLAPVQRTIDTAFPPAAIADRTVTAAASWPSAATPAPPPGAPTASVVMPPIQVPAITAVRVATRSPSGAPAPAAAPLGEAQEPDGALGPQDKAAHPVKRAKTTTGDTPSAIAPTSDGAPAARAVGPVVPATANAATVAVGSTGKPADRPKAPAGADAGDPQPGVLGTASTMGMSQAPRAAALPIAGAAEPVPPPAAASVAAAGAVSTQPAHARAATDGRQPVSAPSAGVGEPAVVAGPTVPPGSAAPATIPAAIAAPAVAHGGATVAARLGQIGHETGIEIARAIDSKSSALTIRLDPADMGRIEVRLSFDDQGSLRAVVSADNPASLDLLRRDSAQLGQALSDAGVRADAQSFRFDSRAGGDDGGQAWARRQEAASARSAPADTAASEAATAVRYGSLRSSGNLDLFA